ncbi:MAG: Spx/MgsR family RNA polymerase-binding regulatory protein [Ferruginibacter sp.]|nr:Spx/MgsR family RNA polymerase-binding regulatory protein [Ferruginibacter sp.]
MTTITVYGIPNCDTIRKTLDWYKKKNIRVDFYDYKKYGINKEKLVQWCKNVGWEILLNKKSTTWRSLPLEEQQLVINEKMAIQLMMEYPSIIKRPVIEMNNKLMVGFNEKYFTKQ